MARHRRNLLASAAVLLPALLLPVAASGAAHADEDPTCLQIVDPTPSQALSGNAEVTAADNCGDADLYVDGSEYGSWGGETGLFPLNTHDFANGHHALSLYASSEGVMGPSVDVVIDNTAPTAELTSPVQGARLNDSQLELTASVTAQAAGATIDHVTFSIDGTDLDTDLTAPYSTLLDTTAYTDGSSHELSVTAYDTSGNSTTSEPVQVTFGPVLTYLSLTRSASLVGVGGRVTLTGQLFNAEEGDGLGGQTIALQVRRGSVWFPAGSGRTDAWGLVHFTQNPTTTTTWRVVFTGANPYRGVSSPATMTTVVPALRLSAASRVKHGGTLTLMITSTSRVAGEPLTVRAFDHNWYTVGTWKSAAGGRTRITLRVAKTARGRSRVQVLHRTTSRLGAASTKALLVTIY